MTTAITKTKEERLAHYDAAREALVAAKSTDEVAAVRDAAIRMRLYARQAKDKALEADAAEIRARAELRLGELMRAQCETIGLARGGNSVGSNQYQKKSGTGFSKNPVPLVAETGQQEKTPEILTAPAFEKPATLAEAGIDKSLADRARKAAAMPPEVFEAHIEEVRAKVFEPRGPRFGRLPTPEEEAYGEKIIAEAETYRWALPWNIFIGHIREKLKPWLANSPFAGKPIRQLEEIRKELDEALEILVKMKGDLK